jgi:hypothetical protein
MRRGGLQQLDRLCRLVMVQCAEPMKRWQVIELDGCVLREPSLQIVRKLLRLGRISGHGKCDSGSVLYIAAS